MTQYMFDLDTPTDGKVPMNKQRKTTIWLATMLITILPCKSWN